MRAYAFGSARRRSTRSLALMRKLVTSARAWAVGIFLIFASLPIGIWLIVAPYWSRSDIVEMLNPWSALGGGGIWLVLAISGTFSIIAAAILTHKRHRNVVRGVLASGAAVSIAYCVVGLWPLGVVSSIPLWFTYRAQHEG